MAIVLESFACHHGTFRKGEVVDDDSAVVAEFPTLFGLEQDQAPKKRTRNAAR